VKLVKNTLPSFLISLIEKVMKFVYVLKYFILGSDSAIAELERVSNIKPIEKNANEIKLGMLIDGMKVHLDKIEIHGFDSKVYEGVLLLYQVEAHMKQVTNEPYKLKKKDIYNQLTRLGIKASTIDTIYNEFEKLNPVDDFEIIKAKLSNKPEMCKSIWE
jgi:hypothetical protein